MNKENPKKNKKSFEYYIAQRKEEFRAQRKFLVGKF